MRDYSPGFICPEKLLHATYFNMTFGESVGQRGLYLLASGLVLFLAASSWPCVTANPTATARSCNVSGNIYSSGQIFTLPGQSPCFKYLCKDGSVSSYSAACEYNGTCHSVGSSFDDECTTYGCSNTTKSPEGYTIYQTFITKTRCQDANGVCRDPGSTFPYEIDDKVYKNCTCTVSSSNDQVSYSCRCQDAFGVCWDPGSKFTYTFKGQLYQTCTCTVSTSNGQVRYSCALQ